MTAVVLRSLARRHWLLFTAYWLVVGAAATIIEVARPLPDTGYHVVLRMVSGVSPRLFLCVVGLLLVVVHLPVHVAHGVTRRDFAVASAVPVLETNTSSVGSPADPSCVNNMSSNRSRSTTTSVPAVEPQTA